MSSDVSEDYLHAKRACSTCKERLRVGFDTAKVDGGAQLVNVHLSCQCGVETVPLVISGDGWRGRVARRVVDVEEEDGD